MTQHKMPLETFAASYTSSAINMTVLAVAVKQLQLGLYWWQLPFLL